MHNKSASEIEKPSQVFLHSSKKKTDELLFQQSSYKDPQKGTLRLDNKITPQNSDILIKIIKVNADILKEYLCSSKKMVRQNNTHSSRS